MKLRDFVAGATTEVASLKKALSKAEHKAALDREESEKKDARVGRYNKSSGSSAKSSSPWSMS